MGRGETGSAAPESPSPRRCHSPAPVCVCLCVCARACACLCVSVCMRARVSLAVPQYGNSLGPEGAGKLAGALEKMTNLQKLDLVTNKGGGG